MIRTHRLLPSMSASLLGMLPVPLLLFLAACGGKESDESPEAEAVPFAKVEYAQVRILSIDRDKEGDDRYPEILTGIPDGYGGTDSGFVDTTGRPVHKHVRSTTLDTAGVRALRNVFRPCPNQESPLSTCLPIYRDAIVFYDDQDRPTAWINICFQCEQLTMQGLDSDRYGLCLADHDRFTELRDFFERLGHETEGGDPNRPRPAVVETLTDSNGPP